jgi:glycosyltransferase involved in cell wall biosynthesis
LLDQNLRQKLKERGYEQVQKFSWEASALAILNAYKEITNQRGKKSRLQKATELVLNS